jgi:hypothetical protein
MIRKYKKVADVAARMPATTLRATICCHPQQCATLKGKEMAILAADLPAAVHNAWCAKCCLKTQAAACC